MRRIRHFSAVLTLFLLVPASITWAQTITSQKGLTTAVFTVNEGTIKVYLPDDIRRGDIISGTVVAEPGGRNDKQLERNLDLLSRYSISLNGQRFSFNKAGKSSAIKTDIIQSADCSLALAGENSTIPVQQLTLNPKKGTIQGPVPVQCTLPGHVLAGSPMNISGPFDGNAANTQCTIANKPATILAESPRSCIVDFPSAPEGVQPVQVQESGQQPCIKNVSAVQMNVVAGKLNLRRGEQTTITVTISGLQGLTDTALLSLVNLSADIVVLQPSNTVIIPLAPGEVSSGNFSRQFDVQSLRTGNFFVNVNLDLPGVMLSPQPGEYNTPQNAVVVKGPKCECVVKASVKLFQQKDDVVTYMAMPAADCRGPECAYSNTIRFTWQVVTGNENGEIIQTGENGFTIKVKRKNANGFTIKNTATVTCSDGTSCTDAIEFDENGETPGGQVDGGETVESTPDQPGGGNCECSGSCSVIKTGESATHISFQAVVRAVCKGTSGTGDTRVVCEVGKIEFKWHLSDKSKEAVDFDGPADKKDVKLKIKGPGQYVLNLTVTITCSDGKTCILNCNMEGTIPPPVPVPPKCLLSWEESPVPAMTGKLRAKFIKTYTIRRDEFIPLGAEGSDNDQLIWSCNPVKPECLDEGGSRKENLNGRVRFEWMIKKGEGSFVKLGCLPDNEPEAAGDYTIFKPPVVPLPVNSMDTVLTTLIILKIIDDNPTQVQDETVFREIKITTKRSRLNRVKEDMDKPAWKAKENNILEDLYEITVTSDSKDPEGVTLSLPPSKPTCKPLGPMWTKSPQMENTKIELPAVPDNETILLGQWITLNAKDVRDKDVAQKIYCESQICTTPGAVTKIYEDNVQFNWTLKKVSKSATDKEIGLFGNDATTDQGSVIIYKAPDIWPADLKEDFLEVKIELYATNPGNGDRKDAMTKTHSISLKIYKPGDSLTSTPEDWLPEEDKSASFTSQLVYRKGGKWEKAPPHACRIHFFELMQVSRFKGICMNYPEPAKADSCRDLYLEGTKLFEVHTDTITEKCDRTGLYLQGRSLKPENVFSIDVHAQDYGAIGYLRSFANLNRGGSDSIRGEKPLYIPVPDKRMKYSDNRVILPLDINEDSLPDNGWPISKTLKIIYSGKAGDDKDDKPAGNGFTGDGFTAFEEYRGFQTIRVGEKAAGKPGDREIVMAAEEENVHTRMNPVLKDLLVRNKHHLPLASFRTATGLGVHEISALQYIDDETRTVNFNFIPEVHLTEQKGIYLYDGGTHPGLLGNAWNNQNLCKKERPAPPFWEDSIVIYGTSLNNAVTAINEEVKKKNAELEKKKKEPLPLLNEGLKLAQVTAHELGHGVNICHHGEGEPKNAESHNWPHGLRSGNMDCIMRYDNTGDNQTNGAPEVPGTTLCDNPAGTGYNRNPEKYGSANVAEGRGNCQSQLQVSPLYGLPGTCLRRRGGGDWDEYNEAVQKIKKEEEKKRLEEERKKKRAAK